MSARIPGFYKLSLAQRHTILAEKFKLTPQELSYLSDGNGLTWQIADKMVENCIGTIALPVGLGLNFLINGKDYVVPMAVEEPSIIAAVSNMAKLTRADGGFETNCDAGEMISQIQVVDIEDQTLAQSIILSKSQEIIDLANQVYPSLKQRGGGATRLEVRLFESPYKMLVVHLIVDCLDAMGANAVNAMAEGVAPLIEKLSGGKVYLRILSNLADLRLARAKCKVAESSLGTGALSGEDVARGIVEAYRFAYVDPYRAATHNKGIMNGIDAVGVATGNDWRGIEAGAHAYAARSGVYRSLTTWYRKDGYLHGEIELPLAVATVGGSTQVHPTLKVLRKLLNVESAKELAGVMASVGLAQNMGALNALATEGIQRGHMSLHARSVALAVGAQVHEVDALAEALIDAKEIKESYARELLAKWRENR
jgi:hydroxymethylglutaryl-CoA reductase